MMRVRLSTILLKDLIASKNFIPIDQCNEKRFFGINSMIDCSFIQNYQRALRPWNRRPTEPLLSVKNFVSAECHLFYQHQYDLLPTLDRFESYARRTSCKQDVGILGAMSKFLPRSGKENLCMYVFIVSDISVPRTLSRSLKRYPLLLSAHKVLSEIEKRHH